MAIRPKTTTKRSSAAKTRTSTVKKTARKAPVAKKTVAKKAAPAKRSAASKPKSNKLHHRAHHHIKKHLLRYVGGATALFILTLASQTGMGEAAQAKLTSTKTKKGYLVIFSESGKYNQVGIQVNGYGTEASNAKRKCSGATFNKNGYAPLKLNNTNRKLTCDVTSGRGQYSINYDGGRTVAVDVDADYCTFVYENSAQIRKDRVNKKGGCDVADKNPVVTKENPVMRVLGQPAKNNKSITGYVEVGRDGNGPKLNKSWCTGQVKVYLNDTAGKRLKTKNASLKFVDNKKSPPYCVVSYNMPVAKGGDYVITADYPGGKFFNGSNSKGGTIKVAAQPAKKK